MPQTLEHFPLFLFQNFQWFRRFIGGRWIFIVQPALNRKRWVCCPDNSDIHLLKAMGYRIRKVEFYEVKD